MADNDEPMEKKRGVAAEESKALDGLTDQHEEREINQAKIQNAMKDIADTQKAAKEAQAKREKELAAVTINKDDIGVISAEFEVDSKAAELRLRECGGDLKQTLKSFLVPA
mmetsp:Transcript_30399/g.78096  ORF Transcript_30399/g.78096 Transcript_30399/m.78096 type:complete len:111 (+) Transcript_30399:280-612(+)|eukprot:jgi/Tetstr1/437005/TSEL_002744.t1